MPEQPIPQQIQRFSGTSLPDDTDRREGSTLKEAIESATKFLQEHWGVRSRSQLVITLEDGRMGFEVREGAVARQVLEGEVV